MKVGLAEPAIAPPILLRGTQALAVAGGAASYWLPDHLINVLPRSLWKPEHIGLARFIRRPDAFLEPFTTLGWMAAKNRVVRLELGVSVTDSARRNPAVTAQAFATLHLMTRGRAALGIGTGERENNEPYGVPWSRPVARFEEAVAVIRALWDSDGRPVSRAGEFFPLKDAVFDVPPFKGTRPPIYVAAHGPRMLRITGRFGDAWMPAWPQSAKTYGERMGVVREAASDAGRDPFSIVGSGWFFVVTAPSAAGVEDLLATDIARSFALTIPGAEWAKFGGEHPLGRDFTGLQDLLPHTIDEATALRYARMVPDGLLAGSFLTGTPAEILERLAEYRDQGLQHPVLLNASPFMHFPKGATSIPALVTLLRRLRRL